MRHRLRPSAWRAVGPASSAAFLCLLAACGPATSAGDGAGQEGDRPHAELASRIETLAHELQQGDPWPAIRDERIRTLLPRAMEAAGVDAWLVICRENGNDHLALHIGCETAGRPTGYLFSTGPSGFELHLVAPESEAVTLAERWPRAGVSTYPRDGDVFGAIARTVREADPGSLAVNRSELAAADGLSATQHEALVRALGPELAQRLTSSEELVVRWLQVKLPAEVDIMRKAALLTDLIEREAFLLVEPGRTTNGDMHHQIRDRIEGLGLGHAWPDNPGITTGLDRGRGSDLNRIIKQGDLINIDAGVNAYGIWNTDLQRFAYVLRPGESEAPDSIQFAWESGVLSSRRMVAFMRPGVAGWPVDSVQMAVQDERGSLRHWANSGHPVGYWTHDVGPRIGGYEAGIRTGDPARPLEPGMMFGLDGNYVWPATDEGVEGTKSITIEEMPVVTEGGAEYMIPPQEDLVLVPPG